MQASLEQIAEYIKGAKTVAISGHVNPDGDSIGSVMGLTACLRSAGYEVTPLLGDSGDVSDRYSYLSGLSDFVHSADYSETPDLFISVDTSTEERMGNSYDVMLRASKSVSIDHHQGSSIGAEMVYVDENAAAAAMLVWKFAKIVGVPISQELVDACYTGILTDTGIFQFQNADGNCMRCVSEIIDAGANAPRIATSVYQSKPMGLLKMEGEVASRMQLSEHGLISYSWVSISDFERLGIEKKDTEGLVDIVRSVAGIEVALLMREENDLIRCNIRSKKDVDVSFIAKSFGGGGHKAASGFSIKGTLEENIETIKLVIADVESQIAAGTLGSCALDVRGLERA